MGQPADVNQMSSDRALQEPESITALYTTSVIPGMEATDE
jgi:hypothetical protein